MSVPLWQHAASFAARVHRHALRKDGETPFIAHPFRVALTVRQEFGCDDPVALAAALLHDTIEDTNTDYDDLLEGFGAEVADAVAALTKNKSLPEPDREAEYDARLARADWRARLVKLADAFDNLSDPSGATPGSRERLLSRCRRALALAETDAAAHPETRRGIEALRAAMARAGAGGG